MPLRQNRRVTETTPIARDLGLVLRRLVAAALFLGLATALGVLLPGLWKLVAGIVAIPGVYTLLAIRKPFTAPCPGCGRVLGGDLIVLPDEPVVGAGALNLRCHDCGIYLDAPGGSLREVPFNRTLDGPGFELMTPTESLPTLDWGDGCVCCGKPATRSLRLSTQPVGVLSAAEAQLAEGLSAGRVPYCAEHGSGADPVARGVIVARTGASTTIQLSQYGAYRRLLDGNRTKIDVALKALSAD